MSVTTLWELVNRGGLVGALVFAIGALWSGLVVPRPVYRAQQRETRFYKRAFWVAAGLAKGTAPTFDFDHEEEII